MSDRLLDRFLEVGLLDLKGNDEWYEHLASTAESLATYLKANPNEIVPFTYAAVSVDVDDKNPAIVSTLALLRQTWKTYASVSMASPKAMLRAIILDALLASAESDDATRSALALLLASALPHLSIGKENEVWRLALDALLSDVERKAEAAWSVPSRMSVAAFPKIKVPPIRFSLKGVRADREVFEKAMFAAAGPHDLQGHITNGNPNWSSSGQSWSNEFVPQAVTAISNAIAAATRTRTGSVKTEPLAEALTSAIVNYLESFAGQIASTTHGLEMRSRLLWWKEALVSPSARVSYRDVNQKAVPGLMAYDYQYLLPSLAPASVSAFLLETVRRLQPDNDPAPLIEWLQALAGNQQAEALREAIREMAFVDGYRPLVSLVTADKPRKRTIKEQTVFVADRPLTAGQFALLIFLELQALKATSEIVPFVAQESSGSTGADPDEEAAA